MTIDSILCWHAILYNRTCTARIAIGCTQSCLREGPKLASEIRTGTDLALSKVYRKCANVQDVRYQIGNTWMVTANGTACMDMRPVYKMKSVQMDNRM